MTDVGTGANGTLRMVASEASYDAGANTSVVSWALYLIENNSSVYSSYNPAVGSNSVVVDGTTRWSGSFGFDWRPAGIQTTLIASGSTTVGHNANGTKTLNVTGNMGATGTTGAGGPTSATQGLTLTTLLLPPAAVTGGSVTRVTDAQQALAWTNNPATRAPYTGLKVRRRDNVNTSWVQVATLSVVSSWADNSTAADREYEYEVAPYNSAGTGTYAPMGTVSTTPTAASSVTATKEGVDIVASWVVNSTNADAQDLQASADGGAWSTIVTGMDPALATKRHTAPSPASTWKYRISTRTTTPALSSTSGESNTVQLTAPPTAPTGLYTAPASVADATEPLVFGWQHNPVDASAQRRRQVRYRQAGSPTWVEGAITTTAVKSLTATPATDLSIPNGQSAELQVRTWGDATTGGSDGTGASPWSATATVALSTRPTGTTSSPVDGVAVTTSKVTVTWAYYDAEGTAQAAWKAELLNSSGAVLETRTGVGAGDTTTFATTVPDGSTRGTRVTVTDGSGMLSVPDTVEFPVAYALPPAPTVEAEWQPELGAVVLAIANPGPTGGEVAAAHNDVWRSRDGGEWEMLYTGVPVDTAVTDWSPTVAGTTEYRIDAVSALPSSSSSAVLEVVTPELGDPAPSLWLSCGPAYSQVVRGTKNIETTALPGLLERVVRYYAGRTKGMQHAGTRTKRQWLVTLELLASDPAASSPAAWEAMGTEPGPFLLRTADMYVYCSVRDLAVRRGRSGAVHSVGFTAEEVGRE